MVVPPSQIAYRKRVGTLSDDPIMEVGLVGGLHMIVRVEKGKQIQVMGVGPHRAVARHIASKKEPKITWTELSKADTLELEHFQWCLPRYEAITEEMRALEGSVG